jgi:hypothetical protein
MRKMCGANMDSISGPGAGAKSTTSGAFRERTSISEVHLALGDDLDPAILAHKDESPSAT